MTGIALPVGITFCFIGGTFSETPRPNKATFQPELGPPMLRRRGTARTYESSGVLKMTRQEVETFWSWYEDDLKDGTLPFTAQHPFNGATFDWQFAAEPSIIRLAPRRYDVSISVLRLP